jgi:hypothetical protein
MLPKILSFSDRRAFGNDRSPSTLLKILPISKLPISLASEAFVDPVSQKTNPSQINASLRKKLLFFSKATV